MEALEIREGSPPSLYSSPDNQNGRMDALSGLSHITFRIIVGLTIVWAICSLFWPYGWDQGLFAWVGDVITRGGMPYRDAWEIKGPLTYYIYALTQVIFGKNLWGVRVIDLTFVSIGAFALFDLTRRLTDLSVARWTGTLFVLAWASGSFWNTAQPDCWATVLILLAVAPFVCAQNTVALASIINAGLLIGCAILIKPIYITFSVVILTAVFLIEKGFKRLIQWTAFGLSLVLPLALAAAWFAYRGALSDFILVSWVYPYKIYAAATALGMQHRAQGVIEEALSGKVVVVLVPVFLLGLITLWRTQKAKCAILVSWISVAVFQVAYQNRFFEYHWTAIYPPLAILSAIGFRAAFEEAPQALSNTHLRLAKAGLLPVLLFLVLLFHVSIRPAFEVANWLAYVAHFKTEKQYYDSFGIPGADIEASNYIRAYTQENDRILMWGWNTSIIYMSGRQSASRFGYSMPLLMGEGTHTREEYRTELIACLAALPPKYIVVAPQSTVILGKDYALDDFPALRQFLHEYYSQEQEFGNLALYRLANTRSALHESEGKIIE